MTNKGPRRAATDGEWSGRLTQAREFHERDQLRSPQHHPR